MSATAFVPFSEPPYIVGLPSPYYKETHLRWQKACRAFVQKNMIEKALEWDTAETVPEHVFETFAKANMLIPTLPAPLPVEWLKKLGIHDILGVVKVEEWDYIHTMIYADEVQKERPVSKEVPLSIANGNARWHDLVSEDPQALSQRACRLAYHLSINSAINSYKSASYQNS